MTRRRVLYFVPAVAAVVALAGGGLLADTVGMATKHVYVDVAPNVTVGAVGGSTKPYTASGGPVQTGEFFIPVPVRIDANKEQVTIVIEATPLWKGNDPFNRDVKPIELCGSVEIDPEHASPIASSNGGSRIAPASGAGIIIHGSRSSRFAPVTFESSQNGHFSQDVIVTPCWNQGDPELPTGQYSGWVKFTALLFPETR